MKNPSKPFTTTDLTLATFLITQGHVAEKVKQGERGNGYPIGGWRFDDNSEALKALIIEFKSSKARVEPKAFHDSLNAVREEMFGFLGIGKRTKKGH